MTITSQRTSELVPMLVMVLCCDNHLAEDEGARAYVGDGVVT